MNPLAFWLLVLAFGVLAGSLAWMTILLKRAACEGSRDALSKLRRIAD